MYDRRNLYDAACAAIADGATTATDVAKVLGMTRQNYYSLEVKYPQLRLMRNAARAQEDKAVVMAAVERAEAVLDSAQSYSPTALAAAMGVSRQRWHQIEGNYPALKNKRLQMFKEQLESRRGYSTARAAVRRGADFYADVLRKEQCAKLARKKANSIKAGVPFDLVWEDLAWPTLCPILGIPIDYLSAGGGRNEASCSFDRHDNTLGYVKGNVSVVSWRGNRIKNDGTAEEHRKVAAYLDKMG